MWGGQGVGGGEMPRDRPSRDVTLGEVLYVVGHVGGHSGWCGTCVARAAGAAVEVGRPPARRVLAGYHRSIRVLVPPVLGLCGMGPTRVRTPPLTSVFSFVRTPHPYSSWSPPPPPSPPPSVTMCLCCVLCCAAGLRYDDLLNEYDPEVRRTIETMPPEEAELRAKRLTRAIDVDLKKTQLPDDIASKQDIWNPYISSRLGALKQAQIERQSE